MSNVYSCSTIIDNHPGAGQFKWVILSPRVKSVLTGFPPALLALRLYAIWNNNPRIFLLILLMGTIMPITNIVSCINYLLPTLTPAKQIVYTLDTTVALPSPFVGCGTMGGASNVRGNVVETYVFLSCIQWPLITCFAASVVSSRKYIAFLSPYHIT